MPTRIRDIARLAGVSPATVSRVLNQPEKVLPQTRQMVLDVVQQTGYVPNPLAKALSTGQTNLVAMVLPNLTNPVFAQMAEGCQEVFSRHHLNLVVLLGQRPDGSELELLHSIDQRQVKGFILSGSAFTEPGYGPVLDLLKVPAVVLEQLPDGTAYSAVSADDAGGFRTLTRRLMDRGHRHIGVISGQQELMVTQRRLSAIRQAAAAHNPNIRITIEPGVYADLHSGRDAFGHLMQQDTPPTGLICLNDMLAFGALQGAQNAGLNVPQDMEIVAYDDIPMAEFTRPALSTVRAPNRQLGVEAARLLLRHLDDPGLPPQQVVLPVELVIRESSY